MKRLTEYTIPETGFAVVSEEKYKRILMEEKPSVEKVYNRLKKIEDILGDEYDLDELKEKVQAKREGRRVVLPYKKGDTVWRIVHDATPHVTKDRCTDIKYENGDIWVHLIGDRVMGGWNFGKLLFLTHAEAEEALRREQGCKQ